MNSCFYTNSNIKEITRTRANGYKKLVIDKTVKSPCMAKIVSEDLDTDCPLLVIKAEQSDKTKPTEYILLCKEIGFVGYNANFENDISVIFCDNDYMLITLHKGMVVVPKNSDELELFILGVDKVPKIEQNNILWKSAKDLLGFARYMKPKDEFPFDFEFRLVVSGGVDIAMEQFEIKHKADEDKDISLGAFAVLSTTVDKAEVENNINDEEQSVKKKHNLDRYFS